MSPDDLLTGPQIAALLGVGPATWRGYVSRGQAPAADDPDDGNPNEWRRNPRWRRSTVEAWRKARRGQEWRAGEKSGG
jgi:hypothetical protein